MEKNNSSRKKTILKILVRLELWFAPLLIIMPMIVSMLLVGDWYIRGFSQQSILFNGELILGLLLFSVNFFFDVLFIRSIRLQKKKEF